MNLKIHLCYGKKYGKNFDGSKLEDFQGFGSKMFTKAEHQINVNGKQIRYWWSIKLL